MEISVEETGALSRRMVVNVPEERIGDEVESRLKSIARTTRLDGFRPGKVPIKVLRKRFGPRVRQEVVSEVMQKTFEEAIASRNLRLAGSPQIQPSDLGEGEGLSFTATFEIFPEIQEVTMPGAFKIASPVVEITDADIENMVQTLRKQHTQWKAVERSAATGDQLTIDYNGSVDGEALNSGKSDSVKLVLGSNAFGIDGFEQGLEGVAAGESRSLDLNLPAQFPNAELAGKQARFEIAVKQVEEPHLPDVDEKLFKLFGIRDGGEEAFRAEIKANMERERDQAIKARVKNRVFDAILEANPIDIPEIMVAGEMERLSQNLPGSDREIFRDEAVRRSRLGLLVHEVVRSQGLHPDPEKIRQVVEGLAASYENPAEVVKWYYSDRQRLAEMESLVMEDEVVEWGLQQGEKVDEDMSFDDLMKHGQTA